MKYIINLTLAAFLVGCGGGGSEDTTSSKNSINNIEENSKKVQPNGNKIKADKNGKIKTIKLSGSSNDVVASKSAIFVAKGEDGVDVVKIGYKDTINSELITAIDGVNAKSVSLSENGKKLYVENEQGFINVYNINNLANPQKEKTTTKQEIIKSAITEDKNYMFVPKAKKGLEIYDISNPSKKELKLTFNKSNAYDVVLVDRDSKALLAAGESGINLLDITSPLKPNLSVNFKIEGGTQGLSLNKEEGILFVANGDKGVLVYSLNIILDKLTK